MACDICRGNIQRKKFIIKRTEIFMEKKSYSKPVLEIETFLANHYCAACFTATGKLECLIADGVEHGYPCANTKFTISYEKGVLTGTAREMNENGTVKTTMKISDINVPCGWADIENWKDTGCTDVTWENEDNSRPPHHYDHKGTCTIETFGWSKPGHPMHS